MPESDNSKITAKAKPLTRGQVWNVFVRQLPWQLLVTISLVFAGAFIGHYQTVNSYEREATIKAEAVQSVSKQ